MRRPAGIDKAVAISDGRNNSDSENNIQMPVVVWKLETIRRDNLTSD